MTAYIIRLDDACPTMDSNKWTRFEDLLDKHNIKPIVAVIPCNEDPELLKENSDGNFWKKVSAWEKKGWAIAMHGCTHVYTTKNPGLVPINKRSEFAGVDLEMQKSLIRRGIKKFEQHNIKTDIFVAPSHSFDRNTLRALSSSSKIQTISDGIGLYPFKKYGFNWIPQQIWRFRKMPFGCWTACFHPNEISDQEFKALELFLDSNSSNFKSLDSLRFIKFSLTNIIFSYIYWFLMRLKNAFKV